MPSESTPHERKFEVFILVFVLTRLVENELVEPGEPGFLAFFLRRIFLDGFPSSRVEVVLLCLMLLNDSDSDLLESGSVKIPAYKYNSGN